MAGMEYRRFTRQTSQFGLSHPMQPHYQSPLLATKGSFYGNYSPMMAQPRLFATLTTVAMISSDPPVSRSFTTIDAAPQPLSLSCDQLLPQKHINKTEEKSSMFNPILSAVSRIFTNIMRSLEDTVSLRNETASPPTPPPPFEFDLSLFYPPTDFSNKATPFTPSPIPDKVPVIEETTMKRAAKQDSAGSWQESPPSVWHNSPPPSTWLGTPPAASERSPRSSPEKCTGDPDNCRRRKRAKDCLCRKYSPHRKMTTATKSPGGKHSAAANLRRKALNKNRSEKHRHEILHDILDVVESEDELEEAVELEHTPTKSTKVQLVKRRGPSEQSNPTAATRSPGFTLSSDDFPTIGSPMRRHCKPQTSPKRVKPTRSAGLATLVDSRPPMQHARTRVESISEDFIVFDTDSTKSTPSVQTSPTRAPISMLIDRLKCGSMRRNRVRQISECSDDSFVICFESDDGDDHCDDFSEEEDDDSELDDTSDGSDEEEDVTQYFSDLECSNGAGSGLTQQPDSGFEEKKVRFNLTPKVHVMHTWDFAYRAARKGHWEEFVRDQERFKRRIEKLSEVISPVLDRQHREKILKERFSGKQQDDALPPVQSVGLP